jgi:hypothetical protein
MATLRTHRPIVEFFRETTGYYELKTNTPLYMKIVKKEYTLTHDDSDVARHYGWKFDSRLPAIGREYRELKQGGRQAPEQPDARALEPEVRRIIADLDDQGRWVSTYSGERLVGQPKFSPNTRYLASEVFSRNVETLAEYLRATRPR